MSNIYTQLFGGVRALQDSMGPTLASGGDALLLLSLGLSPAEPVPHVLVSLRPSATRAVGTTSFTSDAAPSQSCAQHSMTTIVAVHATQSA